MRRESNLRYRESDKRWEGRVPAGRREDGTLIYDSVYGKTRHEAVEKKREREKEIRENQVARKAAGGSLTFSEVSARLMAVKEDHWRQATYTKYEQCLDKHLLPCFGKVPVCQITQYSYSEFFLNCQSKKNLGQASMNQIHTVFTNVMKFAAQILPVIIPRFDKPVGATTKRSRPATTLDKEERERLEKRVLEELRLENESGEGLETPGILVGIFLARHTGLRNGELCGLRWEDIDLRKGFITVSRTLQRLPVKKKDAVKKGGGNGSPKTELVIGAPKNGRTREVPIPLSLLPVLRQYMEQHCPKGFVLSGTEKPVEPRTLRNRFKRFLERAGLRDVCFHTLRHTFATECTEKGVEAKVVSEVLGHADIVITLKRYVHLSPEYKKEQILACGL